MFLCHSQATIVSLFFFGVAEVRDGVLVVHVLAILLFAGLWIHQDCAALSHPMLVSA